MESRLLILPIRKTEPYGDYSIGIELSVIFGDFTIETLGIGSQPLGAFLVGSLVTLLSSLLFSRSSVRSAKNPQQVLLSVLAPVALDIIFFVSTLLILPENELPDYFLLNGLFNFGVDIGFLRSIKSL